MVTVRLKEFEIEAIKSAVRKYDENAQVYLFGSRTDDAQKGGDIDIIIISDILTFNEKTKIRLELYEKLGEQKIDIIITKEIKSVFLKLAYE
jgi:predicted nucleotidyltransferase